jgi:hypothetical protein
MANALIAEYRKSGICGTTQHPKEQKTSKKQEKY